MPDFFASAANGLFFVAAALFIVFGAYFLARKALPPGAEGDRTHDAASTIAVRIAALHGLILALVYAQELGDYKDIRADLMEEAVAISDVYNDVHRYGGPIVLPVQKGLADYLVLVIDEEWDLLGARKGLAWIAWNDVYERLLDLTPGNDRERYLSGRMKDRITAVARFRQIREATAAGGFSGLFWGPALIGLVLLSVPFYVYRPTRSHLFLLSIFGIYSGVILFFIYAFANPFVQPGKLEPVPFQHLLDGDIGKSLATPSSSNTETQ